MIGQPPAAAGCAGQPPALRQSSSLRSRDPERTYEIAAPLMRAFGISRVTDITRMDRLGLPVFASVRPRSRTVHVHAGKGVRPAEARIGALMEALELAVAEPASSAWTPLTLSLGELAETWSGGFRFFDLAPRMTATPTPGQRTEAVECEELGSGAATLLPSELVFLPHVQPEGETLFSSCSTGLASGNTLDEATLHALLEVLERDAVTMNTASATSAWIDPGELPEPLRGMAARWASLGVTLAVRHFPNAFGLPCFHACLHEADSPSVNLASGFGLHPDRGIAVARAICEAAQSRLSHIHGGRADITNFYERCAPGHQARRQEDDARSIAARFDTGQRLAFDDVPQVAIDGLSVRGLLDVVLERLRERGFASVLRHRFAADLRGLHVVKVVVPRCEDFDTDSRRIGPRLHEKLFGHVA